MSVPVDRSYDSVPYPSLSHANTHPDCLGVMAVLSGMQPAAVEHCRVLELGCASGGNIIPMAYALPGSEFVGIDLSANQIKEGEARIAQLGLTNIRLLAMDILEFDAELGLFDYIIAHGIYSWVPEPVRQKLLTICRTHLRPPFGVGFISYNTFPGWDMINIPRGIMRFYTREITDPQQQAEQARESLRFFGKITRYRNGIKTAPQNDLPSSGRRSAVPSSGQQNVGGDPQTAGGDPQTAGGDAYSEFLCTYSDYIEGNLGSQMRKYDAALLHDELEEINQPFYFYQFHDQAGQAGLQYVGDMCHYDRVTPPPEVLDELRKRSHSLMELEQALDFYEDRTFRQTLVCLAETPLSRKVTPAIAQHFFIASNAEPVEDDADIPGKAIVRFRSKRETYLATDHPCSKAAMMILAQAWPGALAFSDLLDRSRAWLAQAGYASTNSLDVDANVLGANILRAFSHGGNLVDLHTYSPFVSLGVPEAAMVSPVVRMQAKEDGPVTTLRHQRYQPDGFDRFLLSLLDGTHSQADLLRLTLEGPVAAGALTIKKYASPLRVAEAAAEAADEAGEEDADEAATEAAEEVSDPQDTSTLQAVLNERLRWYARAGLLIKSSPVGADAVRPGPGNGGSLDGR